MLRLGSVWRRPVVPCLTVRTDRTVTTASIFLKVMLERHYGLLSDEAKCANLSGLLWCEDFLSYGVRHVSITFLPLCMCYMHIHVHVHGSMKQQIVTSQNWC